MKDGMTRPFFLSKTSAASIVFARVRRNFQAVGKSAEKT